MSKGKHGEANTVLMGITAINNKVVERMNGFFFIFILYTSVIWGIDLIATFSNVPILTAVIIVMTVVGAGCFFLRGKVSFSVNLLTKWDVAAFLLFSVVYFMHSPIPDNGWDVISYHILHQQVLPWSQVEESFFPSTMLHSYLFPLGDRLSYPFYYFFGFRMGTVLNLFVSWVIYVQIRQILIVLWEDGERRPCLLSLFSICIIMSINALSQLHTYYVDIRTIPILLFFLYEFINFNSVKNKKMLLFMAWCVGIEICFKMSAGIPLLLCVCYFLFASRKNVSVLLLSGGIILALLPLIPYGYVNLSETQSPIFPYMNQIFQSPLLLHNEDSRNVLGDILFLGPQNLFQALIWPFHEIVQAKPFGITRSEALLVIFAMGAAVLLWENRKEGANYKKIIISYVAFYLFGAIVYHGFMRYNPGLDVVSAILCGFVGIVLFRRTGIQKYIGVVFLLVLLLQPMIFLKRDLGEVGKFFYQDWKNQSENMALLFHDRDTEYVFAEKVNAWLSMGAQPTSGYAYLLKKQVPIIALDGYAPMYADMDGTYENPVARELYEKHMQRWLGNGMYILLQTEPGRPTFLKDGIHQKTLMGELVQILHQRGVRLQNYEQIRPNFIRVNQNITMAEAVPASGSTAFNDYLLKPNSSCKLDKSYQGDSRYILTMALKPDDFGSVPQYSFSGHIDLYDRASGRLLSRQDFASDGEYVTIELSAVGEVEVVFDHTTADSVQELMILAYEEAAHDNGGANRTHTE